MLKYYVFCTEGNLANPQRLEVCGCRCKKKKKIKNREAPSTCPSIPLQNRGEVMRAEIQSPQTQTCARQQVLAPIKIINEANEGEANEGSAQQMGFNSRWVGWGCSIRIRDERELGAGMCRCCWAEVQGGFANCKRAEFRHFWGVIWAHRRWRLPGSAWFSPGASRGLYKSSSSAELLHHSPAFLLSVR